ILEPHQERTPEGRREQLIRLLNEAPVEGITLRNLKNAHGYREVEIRDLVRQSPDRLRLTKRQHPKGGRPSYWVSLLPDPPGDP
ncbi:MAG: hypothetical protein KDM63_19525, partial [Verrucomicrobiae bacterium]|nr:hypothetical protein [Verrucomicrobiae bacterium]